MGRRPDVSPTEWVPLAQVAKPHDAVSVDHLYELGYRDMESWLDENLTQRLAQLSPWTGPDLPPIEFTSANNGMEWHKKLLDALPVTFKDQVLKRTSSHPQG